MTPLLLALPLIAAAPVPKELKDGPRGNLDGRWVVVEFERNGKPASHFQEAWDIRGESLVITRRAAPNLPPREVRLRIDPARTPTELEFTDTSARRAVTSPGVLAFKRERLVVCLPMFAGGERPADPDNGENVLRWTLERAADK